MLKEKLFAIWKLFRRQTELRKRGDFPAGWCYSFNGLCSLYLISSNKWLRLLSRKSLNNLRTKNVSDIRAKVFRFSSFFTWPCISGPKSHSYEATPPQISTFPSSRGATFLFDLPFDLFIVGLCVILPQISIYHFDWLHPGSQEKPFFYQVLRENSHWSKKPTKSASFPRNWFNKCSLIFQIVSGFPSILKWLIAIMQMRNALKGVISAMKDIKGCTQPFILWPLSHNKFDMSLENSVDQPKFSAIQAYRQIIPIQETVAR